MTKYRANLRDRVVHNLANRLIRLASPEYRAILAAVVFLGHVELRRLETEAGVA